MKIIKHGNMMPRRFTCRFCGCIFVADRSEYSTAASGDNFYVNCPDCNVKFDMKAPLYKEEFDELVIVDRTERTDYDDWTHSMYHNWIQEQGV